MGWIGSGRIGVDEHKVSDRTGVGGSLICRLLEISLSELISWSSEGMGGKGTSGGPALGGAARWPPGDMGLIG